MGNVFGQDPQKNEGTPEPVQDAPETTESDQADTSTTTVSEAVSGESEGSQGYHDVAPGVQGRATTDEERAERRAAQG